MSKLRAYKTQKTKSFFFVEVVPDVDQPNFSKVFVNPYEHNLEVTVGPVIGEVSTSGCKILLETNGHVKVRCILQKDHVRSHFEEGELKTLASMQQRCEELKTIIRNEKEKEDDSDAVIIADGAEEIEKLTHKIKSLSAKLTTVPQIVRTMVTEPNDPTVFEFEFGSLESNCKYNVTFEPRFVNMKECSIRTMCERNNYLSISCISGLGRLTGLLHSGTPSGYDTWSSIFLSADRPASFRAAAEAAFSYHKFGESINPSLEDKNVLPLFSDNTSIKYDTLDYASSPRMTKGFYGGASGVGMGGERGLGVGSNVMFLLDKDCSSPRRAPDIVMELGGCGAMEFFASSYSKVRDFANVYCENEIN